MPGPHRVAFAAGMKHAMSMHNIMQKPVKANSGAECMAGAAVFPSAYDGIDIAQF